ncbi:MAG: hypothetical protein DKM50_11325 [Candidatus Margulisiibacteriota bacterium]|nr:MAG: hypothetical protein A2X43_12185 [Candidatus Margulisbacteria bacterium GWD2_39_127]OGI03215.1 MAG: hypothetical protein A2X42_11425 [Candidatus Margulisbacteria bacterium GWF2_38_17]OGI11239.1 MAG: hypothetical protein A2X41_03850 [Candidatus Margulisbacteria bacterium GWE2_39_32]PZM78546.1 MAG: hypothetical protein DKM50_11325 [Candidatus Margulisiibacteriota bacterium]HAR63887.1 hypothetical protein [Candidatus Margulisiibacteriota bacterium]
MQLFCFFIGQQEIGIPIDYVIETSCLESFTLLPNAPKYILGLVNLRGDIVPIINLSKFFKLTWDNSISKILFINKDSILFGIIISKLSKPVVVDKDDINEYPRNINQSIREYFSGIVHVHGRNIQVLDLGKLINSIKNRDS